ncbi:MAG: hypothetical protein KC931_11325 [Candidatus Omnitrophica bacterium]|nr:hypothetical protein [Candidatus Omnitrophota bacterium]
MRTRPFFLVLAFLAFVYPFRGSAQETPTIHVMYYSYFRADFESEDFFQWNGYRSWDGRLHNPVNHLGPELWRYDLALGSGAPGSGMHYPFLGRYDNSTDLEMILWQFRCMKNAGVDAVCGSNLAHGNDPDFVSRMLDVARTAGIQFYVMDENGSGDLGGAANQSDLNQVVDNLIQKCNQTLIAHGTDEAYFRIDNRPVYFLPFWVPAFGVPGIEQVEIMQAALKRFRDGVTVDGREPWLYSTSVYLANFSGDLSYDLNGPPGPVVHMNQGWADTGFESFTCWDPLGIQEQYNRTDIDETLRDQNLAHAFSIYISNQENFGATPIVPIQVGFDTRNNSGPGAGGLHEVDPKYIGPHDPHFWRRQIQLALESGAPHLWIAQWNEWHEDQTLEPGWGFRDEAGNEEPFAFLRILADELGRNFSEPTLPPQTSVDPEIWGKVNAFESPTPSPSPSPTATPTSTATPTFTPTVTDTQTPTHTPSPTYTATPTPPFNNEGSDINLDGAVDALDLLILLEDWGKVTGGGPNSKVH